MICTVHVDTTVHSAWISKKVLHNDQKQSQKTATHRPAPSATPILGVQIHTIPCAQWHRTCVQNHGYQAKGRVDAEVMLESHLSQQAQVQGAVWTATGKQVLHKEVGIIRHL